MTSLPRNPLSTNCFLEAKSDGAGQGAPSSTIHTAGGATIGGDVTAGGDLVGRDKLVYGDAVQGDKVAGDKVAGDKIVHQHGFTADEVTQLLEALQRAGASAGSALPSNQPAYPLPIPETVRVAAANFLLGDDSLPFAPRHPVQLPAFRIGKGLVTNQEYAAFIHQTGRLARPELAWNGQLPAAEQLAVPVTGVTFADAWAYCQWLEAQSGLAFRLPHEAAWEWAAVAGVIEWGMVREWTCSLWGEKLRTPDPPYAYPWQDDARNDPAAGAHLRRVVRGSVPINPRVRSSAPPDQPGAPGKRYGFRVMLLLKAGDPL